LSIKEVERKGLYCAALAVICLSATLNVAAPIAQQRDVQKQTTSLPDLDEASRLSQQVVILYKQGKFDEALPLAKHALELREKRLGPENELVGRALENLASLYFAKKQYEWAARFYQRELSVFEKTLGDHDPKVADVMDSLAWSNYGLGETRIAESYFQRALSIREKAFGAESKEVGESLYTLGQFYQKGGREDKAVKAYRRAIPIVEKAAGAKSKELGTLLEKCACALLGSGEKQEGAGMALRAQMILHQRGPASVVGQVLQGHATFLAEPVYPAEARHNRTSGTVMVEVTVDETGKVVEARSLCGPDLLVGASVEAARHWRFSPTLLSGQPVKVIGTITFNFHL
jgi:TonB family protein